LTRGSYINFLN